MAEVDREGTGTIEFPEFLSISARHAALHSLAHSLTHSLTHTHTHILSLSLALSLSLPPPFSLSGVGTGVKMKWTVVAEITWVSRVATVCSDGENFCAGP
jgi:hypothetical protein